MILPKRRSKKSSVKVLVIGLVVLAILNAVALIGTLRLVGISQHHFVIMRALMADTSRRVDVLNDNSEQMYSAVGSLCETLTKALK